MDCIKNIAKAFDKGASEPYPIIKGFDKFSNECIYNALANPGEWMGRIQKFNDKVDEEEVEAVIKKFSDLGFGF